MYCIKILRCVVLLLIIQLLRLLSAVKHLRVETVPFLSASWRKTQTNPWSSLTAVPRSFRQKGNPPLVVVAATFLDAIADGIDPNPFTSSSGCDSPPQYRIQTREDSLPPYLVGLHQKASLHFVPTPSLVQHPMIFALTIRIPKDTSSQTT